MNIKRTALVKDRKRKISPEKKESSFVTLNNILLEVSKKILDHIPYYDSLLNYIVEKTSNYLGDCCILTMFQDGYAKPVAYYHPDKKITGALSQIFSTTEQHVGEGFVTSRIMKGENVFIPHLNKQDIKRIARENQYEFLEKFRISSLIAVPLEVEGGHIIGQISVSRYNNDIAYTPEDMVFLQKIASRVSFAIVISKLYREKINELEERRMTERKLEQMKQQLSEAERLAKLGSFRINVKTGKAVWSEEMYRIFDLDPEKAPLEIDGIIQFIHPEDRDAFSEKWNKFLENPATSAEFDFRIITSGNLTKYIHSIADSVLDEIGNSFLITGALMDITEQSRLQENLKINEERFRLALTNTPITVFNMDRNLRYTWIYDDINIPDPGVFIGRKAEDFLEPEDAVRLSERKKVILETKIPMQFEECLKIQGKLKYYDMRFEALLDSKGNAIGLKGMSIDITERKNIENRLNDALLALKQSNKELEQFAYTASHDLQEPLRMVTNFTQLLEKRFKGKLGAEEQQYMSFIVNGTQLMQNLISDLLKFSRITSEKTTFSEIDMNEILTSAIQNLSILISEKNAAITYDRLPVLKVDKIQMIQLFQNLIGNAIKFTKEKTPEIFIRCTKENNRWKFSVEDNGIGISPDNFERIFLIFHRLHTREEYDGTGIGLAMCRKIVEHHGGQIWVESEEGKGSAFHFTIPEDFS